MTYSKEEAEKNKCVFGICQLTTGDKISCYKNCSNQRVIAEEGYPHLKSIIQLNTELKYLELIPEPGNTREIERLEKIRLQLEKHKLTDEEALKQIING